jgi:hypothetical protein
MYVLYMYDVCFLYVIYEVYDTSYYYIGFILYVTAVIASVYDHVADVIMLLLMLIVK